MPDITIRVHVLLYPDQAAGQPWPCPADVEIQLKRKGTGARAAIPVHRTTTAGGATPPVQLAEGHYQVSITDPRFTLWEAGELTVESRPTETAVAAVVVAGDESEPEAEKEALAALAEAGAAAETQAELREVGLYPRAGHRLIMIRPVTPDGQPVTGGTVTITAGDDFDQTFTPCSDGTIYAVSPVSPLGPVLLQLASVQLQGQLYCPQASVIPYTVPAASEVKPLEIIYWPAIQIVATPTVTGPDGTHPLPGTSVTVTHQVNAQDSGVSRTKILTDDADGEVRFEYSFPGMYTITVTPPPAFGGLPIGSPPPPHTINLKAGATHPVRADFAVVPTQTAGISVTTPDNQPVNGTLAFEIYNGNTDITVPVNTATLSASTEIPQGIPVYIRLAAGSDPMVGTLPLHMSTPGQAVAAGPNTVALEYEHSLTINAMDEQGRPVPGAMVDVYYGPAQTPVATVVVDAQGSFVLGLEKGGTYYLSEHTVGGQSQLRETVPVNSNCLAKVPIRGNRGGDGEAVTDLSAYPVLTEEISTLGAPAPAAGAPGAGGPGAGYGQTVDQAMRDVLGWRPSADVAGFQAALTGAFQLRQVEGHTEWSWQQRGYAVQADMGALTGAQASIYARAKNTLDQIQPLLAGLTALNPALYEPQDLETIRTVVSTELQELVNELALAGGPRIQRVDELFRLLVGENRKSININPDLVQGQLGILRQRFGLTRDEVQTVDEERIVTNFRIIVEQVLALQNSWYTDRTLLSGVSSRTSLGTILIWLSRGLEAVCESVNDLTFSLDSVYVDAAQRQVVELRFADLLVKDVPVVPLRGNPPKTTRVLLEPDEAPMFLSDLLDWVLRASQDEGPRIIQDAGKQGIFAFQPVLNTLRTLVRATGQLARERNDLPAGMRTPRVGRAIKVLAAQLDEAANLASLVRADLAPQVAFASINDPATGLPPKPGSLARLPQIEIVLTGSNFRPHAKAVLIAADREDVPDLFARPTTVHTPSSVCATFANPAYQGQKPGSPGQKPFHPGQLPNAAGTTWQVSLINDDETQSAPVEVLRVPR